jgi:hypothetical protein
MPTPAYPGCRPGMMMRRVLCCDVLCCVHRSLPSHLGWITKRVAPWIGRTPAKVRPAPQQQLHTPALRVCKSCQCQQQPAGWGLHGTHARHQHNVCVTADDAVQGAEVAVYAATSPTFTADQPVPLLLHDCKPMTPSVSVTQHSRTAQACCCVSSPIRAAC